MSEALPRVECRRNGIDPDNPESSKGGSGQKETAKAAPDSLSAQVKAKRAKESSR